MQSDRRIFGLDVLRAFAILTVLYHHADVFFQNKIDLKLYHGLMPDGVALFFVLSGYLIGRILLKTLDTNPADFRTLKTFWINRWYRTLPAYYVVLVAIIACDIISPRDFPPFTEAIPYFLFSQNFTSGHLGGFEESWSLSIEEWFYLSTPLLFYAFLRLTDLKRATVLVIATVIIGVNLLRCYKIYFQGIDDLVQWDELIRTTIPTRLDSIMFGVLGAYLAYYRFAIWEKNNHLFFYSGLIFLFALTFLFSYYHYSRPLLYLMIPLESLATLMMIPKLSRVQRGRGPLARFITLVSLISYSMYLVHASLYSYILQPLMPNNYTAFAAYLLWAFGLSWILYQTVEKWGMNRRNKINQKLKGQGRMKATINGAQSADWSGGAPIA
jgi:peptidoglycan/LPS O-acetylase OafA/YrhL